MDNELEEWKSYDDWYDVSSWGRVRSWIKPGGKGREYRLRQTTPKLLKLRPDYHGYLRWGNGRLKDESVHRAVANLFIGPAPSSKYEVAHNNGDNTDNRVSNLRWATHSENLMDRVNHGTAYRNHMTPVLVHGIREEHALGYGTTYTIAKRYKTSQTTVARILRKETWAHV